MFLRKDIWQMHWLIDLLIDWSVNWLIGWSVHWCVSQSHLINSAMRRNVCYLIQLTEIQCYPTRGTGENLCMWCYTCMQWFINITLKHLYDAPYLNTSYFSNQDTLVFTKVIDLPLFPVPFRYCSAKISLTSARIWP